MARRASHISDSGDARMVDVGEKNVTERVASARTIVSVKPETLASIRANLIKKGDVVGVARLAGLMAAKRTSELIPLCHQIPLTSLDVDIDVSGEEIVITATARTQWRTGVEMEALTAVSVSALTMYDMCKSIDRDMSIKETVLLSKSGGRSGEWRRNE